MGGLFGKLLAEILEGAARHALSGVGGAFVAGGLLSHDQAVQIGGGVLAAVAVGFSAIQKPRAHEPLTTASTPAAQAAEAKSIEEDLQQTLPLDRP